MQARLYLLLWSRINGNDRSPFRCKGMVLHVMNYKNVTITGDEQNMADWRDCIESKKMAEDTQTLMTSLTKHMTKRGIPNRPDMRSESANEVRNMLVIVLSNFFLWIKRITRPSTATISRHIKDKATINDTGRNSVCSRSVLLLELFPRWLVLDGQDDVSSN